MKKEESNLIQKFIALPKLLKILIVTGISLIILLTTQKSKPSKCDCSKVMWYEEGSVDAAKRILGASYGSGFMNSASRTCGLEYWDEIKKWQEEKGYPGTPEDNAMLYFKEECRKKSN